MEISFFDFFLINFVSYIFGLGTGLIICCKNKDKLLVKSRSNDNLSTQQINHTHQAIDLPFTSPVIASAPPPDKAPIKITLE